MTKEELENLVLNNLPLISLVLKKYNLSYDEYFDLGVIGLVKGAKSFDASKGFKPSSYLTRCITNEIFLQKRKERKLVKNPISLETIMFDDMTIGDMVRDDFDLEDEIIKKEQLNMIKKSLKVLNEKEFIVFTGMYGIGTNRCNQKELAKKLNVSQSNISRLNERAKDKIKKYLKVRVK